MHPFGCAKLGFIHAQQRKKEYTRIEIKQQDKLCNHSDIVLNGKVSPTQEEIYFKEIYFTAFNKKQDHARNICSIKIQNFVSHK